MQSNRGGFARETANIASGEEFEGNKYRHEREIAASRENGTQQSARQSDGQQVAGVQAVRDECRDEEDLGRGQTRVQGQCTQCQWSG